MQSNQGDLAGGRVCERGREGAGDRREAGGYLDEPPAGGRAAPVQHGEEHTADDGGDEGDLGEAGEWILPCTASGTPAARRATAPAVVTAAARTPAETVVGGSVLVNRDGACPTVISGEVVTVDMVGSL